MQIESARCAPGPSGCDDKGIGGQTRRLTKGLRELIQGIALPGRPIKFDQLPRFLDGID
jgi:hypothetical protein